MKRKEKPQGVPTVARVLTDERIVELVYTEEAGRTRFAVWSGSTVEYVENLTTPEGELLIPIRASNNLIRHHAVLLPECAESYGSVNELLQEITEYLHRYVTLSDWFARVARYYVIFTWVHDFSNEAVYLRFVADWGSGKTRASSVLGGICYRGFFASGASTTSPLFHGLDQFRGTLVLDEADFRVSDAKADIAKILNNGTVKGFPVLRTMMNSNREFDPRAFHVFGPKIVAMRGAYEDEALESRFITERLDDVAMRPEIPISLPPEQRVEALRLRNKLLQYRFDFLRKLAVQPQFTHADLSPRMNQMLLPLLSVVEDENERALLVESMRAMEHSRTGALSSTLEADIVNTLLEVAAEEGIEKLSVGALTTRFIERFGKEYERSITNRYMGSLLRNRFGILTYKSHGIYLVQLSKARLNALCDRFGIARDVNRH